MSIDPRALRQTLGQFVTGVTVVAVQAEGDVHAMTANSFTSLSLEPPLVLFCAGRESKAGQLLHVGMRFAVSILAEDQRQLSNYFAGSWSAEEEPPVFTFESWHETPRLVGSVAAVACEVDAIHEGGDHWIVVGRVVAMQWGGPGAARPLVFFRGRYTTIDA